MQTQTVSSEHVGAVETVVPDIVNSPIHPSLPEDFAALPPILRDDISSEMKVLTTEAKYPQLNGFRLLLGLSDRLMRTEAAFFRTPHTTRILWGGHRVIYIFTETTGRLSLYYDIELKDAIENMGASGGPLPTTTLITKKRIFVPVPEPLINQFAISNGSKEFFVRFDVLSTEE